MVLRCNICWNSASGLKSRPVPRLVTRHADVEHASSQENTGQEEWSIYLRIQLARLLLLLREWFYNPCGPSPLCSFLIYSIHNRQDSLNEWSAHRKASTENFGREMADNLYFPMAVTYTIIKKATMGTHPITDSLSVSQPGLWIANFKISIL
jgi:hypothetical protein